MKQTAHNFDKNNLLASPEKLKELEQFRAGLEEVFYSEIAVTANTSDYNKQNLVLEIDCNYGLMETLYLFNNETGKQKNAYPFISLLTELQRRNDVQIDIEELTLFFKDTTIIINRIYPQSIPDHLGNLMTLLYHHRMHYTKCFTEIPYEIYLPVIEQKHDFTEVSLQDIRTRKNRDDLDYFNYLGLYFESEKEGNIYDLKHRCMADGSLHKLP